MYMNCYRDKSLRFESYIWSEINFTKMNHFIISFNYNEKSYSASVMKQNQRPITFLASVHQPHDLNIQYPIPFTASRYAEMLGWVELRQHPGLVPTMADAITQFCAQNGIEIFRPKVNI